MVLAHPRPSEAFYELVAGIWEYGSMKLIAVNVGVPREVLWKGETVTTSIYKSPVDGPVAMRRHNLAGDQQAEKLQR